MHIVLGSDHAGFPLKSVLIDYLKSKDHQVTDLGTFSTDPVDYPPICAETARYVVNGRADVAIVMGGSGQGEAIAANKVHGVRAALCHDEYTARYARLHNDANCLSLGARVLGVDLAKSIVDCFLTTSFEGGRHIARLEEITAIEEDEHSD